jgi:hypothetical protein
MIVSCYSAIPSTTSRHAAAAAVRTSSGSAAGPAAWQRESQLVETPRARSCGHGSVLA